MKTSKFSAIIAAIVCAAIFGISAVNAAVPQAPVIYTPESGKIYSTQFVHFSWSSRGTPEYNWDLQKWNSVTQTWELKENSSIYSRTSIDIPVRGRYGIGKYRFRVRTFSYPSQNNGVDTCEFYGQWSGWRGFTVTNLPVTSK